MLEEEGKERFAPKGQLTHIRYMMYPVVTNAHVNELRLGSTRLNAELIGDIQVQVGDDGLFLGDSDHWPVLRRVGFQRVNPESDERVYQGKFVFMKNGTFFLSSEGVPHIELPMLIGKVDRVAVRSAGFIRLTHDEVVCFGRSESLDRACDDYAQRDAEAIAGHLNIPFKQKA